MLLPVPSDEVDLDEVYAVPSHGRHVRGLMVASLDGSAVLEGGSAALSGPADRRVLSALRGLADVIVTGAGTVRAEGYRPARPTAERRLRRAASGLSEVPPVAVVTATCDLDPAALAGGEARPLVVTTASAEAGRRTALAEVAEVVLAGEQRVETDLLLDALAQRGLRRVLLEGGPALLGQVAGDGRLDELCLTVSPVLAGPGGSRVVSGPSWLPIGTEVVSVLEADGYLFLRAAVSPQS